MLHARDTELGESQAIENLLADLNDSDNAKQGKAWGFLHPESGAHPFSGWLKQYMDATARQRYEALGGRGIPMLDVNGVLFRQFDEPKILQALSK